MDQAAPQQSRPRASFPFLVCIYMSLFLSFPQKSLPLLENKIKDLHQKTTDELQKFGMDIPEDDSEKMFFLIEVRRAGGLVLETPTLLCSSASCD